MEQFSVYQSVFLIFGSFCPGRNCLLSTLLLFPQDLDSLNIHKKDVIVLHF